MSTLLLALLLQEPINAMCPVKPGQRSKAQHATVYKGRVIGLCWQSCVGKFNADPEKFAAAIPEFSAPVGPKAFGTAEDAKAARKPLAALVLADDELRSYLLLRALTDLDVPAVFLKVPFAKDNEDLKRWKVTAPGALVLLDPTAEPPKLIKVLRAPAPAALKKEIADAAKSMRP